MRAAQITAICGVMALLAWPEEASASCVQRASNVPFRDVMIA